MPNSIDTAVPEEEIAYLISSMELRFTERGRIRISVPVATGTMFARGNAGALQIDSIYPGHSWGLLRLRPYLVLEAPDLASRCRRVRVLMA